MGSHCLKTWAKTQGPVALSSGEAEYYSMVKGAIEGLGMQTLARDLGWSLALRLHVDSSAAKAIASRQGMGKIRHLEVRHLWLQQVVREGRLILRKVAGKLNCADLLTKGLGIDDIKKLLGLMTASLKENFSKTKQDS